MKFAITDLSYEALGIALAALNDASVPHTANAPVTPVDAVVEPAAVAAPAPVASQDTRMRDVDNIPWDSRIHSGVSQETSKPTQAGKWKRKKGIDDAVYESVMHKLLTEIPDHLRRDPAPVAPVAAPAPVAPVAAPAPVAPVAAPAPVAPVAPVAAPAPVAPVAAPAPVAPVAPVAVTRTDITQDQLMQYIGAVIADPNQPINAVDLPAICAEFGITSFNDCANNPALIGQVYARLGGV